MNISYDPKPDGRPDPGEVVWAWVPYEDDPSQGKDRPVLLIGRRSSGLVALMLTSQDHDRDAAQEARDGRFWFDLGTGPWDSRGRPSEVRLNRLIEVDEQSIRREGAVLDRARFDAVVAAAAPYLPKSTGHAQPPPAATKSRPAKPATAKPTRPAAPGRKGRASKSPSSLESVATTVGVAAAKLLIKRLLRR